MSLDLVAPLKFSSSNTYLDFMGMVDNRALVSMLLVLYVAGGCGKLIYSSEIYRLISEELTEPASRNLF